MKYVLDMHCHTIASGHAYSTIGEYVSQAARIGLELIAITDHGPKMPGSCSKMHFKSLKIIPGAIDGVEILSGVELNILNANGNVDLSENVLKRLSVNIASIHMNLLDTAGIEDNTAAVINVMKNPYVHVIGHLGDPRFPVNIDEIVSAARDTGTILEINNSSFDPSSLRAGGAESIKQIALCCLKQGLPVVIGSDAHFHSYVGRFEYANRMLTDINMPPELILNTSKKAFLSAISGKNKK